MHENTEFTLSRDTESIQIPSGTKITLAAGTQGVITQTLGGSYTIATPYGLSRIAEKDLDALGIASHKPTAAIRRQVGSPQAATERSTTRRSGISCANATIRKSR